MPQASKRLKQMRRIKRERSLLYRMVEHITKERNQYRQILIDAQTNALRPDLDPKPEGGVPVTNDSTEPDPNLPIEAS